MTWTQIILILGAIPLLVGYSSAASTSAWWSAACSTTRTSAPRAAATPAPPTSCAPTAKRPAALTLAGDMLKGVAAVVLCHWAGMLLTGGVEVNGIYAGYLAAIGAACGHLWPVWFGIKGGKGVAVAAGAILASEPVVLLALAVVFFSIAFASRIVSLASVTVAVLYPIFTGLYSWYTGRNILFTTLCALVMGVLVIWMHLGQHPAPSERHRIPLRREKEMRKARHVPGFFCKGGENHGDTGHLAAGRGGKRALPPPRRGIGCTLWKRMP